MATSPRSPPYGLRSQGPIKSPPADGPPEIIPCRTGTSREGTAASDRDAQKTFLEMMGLLESTDIVSVKPTVSQADAQILCSALDHDYYEEAEGVDRYFTLEEYRRVASRTSEMCRILTQIVQSDPPMSSSEREALLQECNSYSKVCNCMAHAAFRRSDDLFYKDQLGRLISIPSKLLTDHYGTELAESLLPFLFAKGEHVMFITKCGLGSPYTVNFVLQMPSGKMYQFTGRPDFSIRGPYNGAIARYTLRGVGEVQSPPGRTSESKTAALSQAGVYTVGQFTKPGAAPLLPAVVLHKDKTVQVAMASLNESEKTVQNSLGTVSFKLVGQVEPVDLKTEEGLMMFSGQLKGVMDATESLCSTSD